MVGFRIYSPKVTPSKRFEVPEVALSQDEPLSVDLNMFTAPAPLAPTIETTDPFLIEISIPFSTWRSEKYF